MAKHEAHTSSRTQSHNGSYRESPGSDLDADGYVSDMLYRLLWRVSDGDIGSHQEPRCDCQDDVQANPKRAVV